MKTVAKMMLCGVAALGLGGCQSFLADLGLAKRGASNASVAADSTRLELGRTALKAGAPGTAIYHFERAVLDPQQAPEAYNGMGVAYAQLGREDLAERFFNAALMLRPNDERIARNLDRLYNSNIGSTRRAMASKEKEANAVLAQAEADAVAKGLVDAGTGNVEKRGAIEIDRRRGNVQRASRQEVVISGASPAAKVAPARTARTVGSRSQVRIGTTAAPAPKPEPKPEPQPKPVDKAVNEEAKAKMPTKISANTADIDYGQFVCLPGKDGEPKENANYPIRVSLAG